MRNHPVIVFWISTGKTESFSSIKECAGSLQTSTSQIKRLLKSGSIFRRGERYCIIDDDL